MKTPFLLLLVSGLALADALPPEQASAETKCVQPVAKKKRKKKAKVQPTVVVVKEECPEQPIGAVTVTGRDVSYEVTTPPVNVTVNELPPLPTPPAPEPIVVQAEEPPEDTLGGIHLAVGGGEIGRAHV